MTKRFSGLPVMAVVALIFAFGCGSEEIKVQERMGTSQGGGVGDLRAAPEIADMPLEKLNALAGDLGVHPDAVTVRAIKARLVEAYPVDLKEFDHLMDMQVELVLDAWIEACRTSYKIPSNDERSPGKAMLRKFMQVKKCSSVAKARDVIAGILREGGRRQLHKLLLRNLMDRNQKDVYVFFPKLLHGDENTQDIAQCAAHYHRINHDFFAAASVLGAFGSSLDIGVYRDLRGKIYRLAQNWEQKYKYFMAFIYGKKCLYPRQPTDFNILVDIVMTEPPGEYMASKNYSSELEEPFNKDRDVGSDRSTEPAFRNDEAHVFYDWCRQRLQDYFPEMTALLEAVPVLQKEPLKKEVMPGDISYDAPWAKKPQKQSKLSAADELRRRIVVILKANLPYLYWDKATRTMKLDKSAKAAGVEYELWSNLEEAEKKGWDNLSETDRKSALLRASFRQAGKIAEDKKTRAMARSAGIEYKVWVFIDKGKREKWDELTLEDQKLAYEKALADIAQSTPEEERDVPQNSDDLSSGQAPTNSSHNKETDDLEE